MRYFLIVVGKGRERRTAEYYLNRRSAVLALNHYVLDLGIDARLIVSKICPPFANR
jgi:hypothetical protein